MHSLPTSSSNSSPCHSRTSRSSLSRHSRLTTLWSMHQDAATVLLLSCAASRQSQALPLLLLVLLLLVLMWGSSQALRPSSCCSRL